MGSSPGLVRNTPRRFIFDLKIPSTTVSLHVLYWFCVFVFVEHWDTDYCDMNESSSEIR